MKKIIGIALMIICSFGYVSISHAKDWKQCESKIVFINTEDAKMLYRLLWLDHKIPEYHGRPVERAGGELGNFEYHKPSTRFRLCPGRYIMFWSKYSYGKWIKYKAYMFVVTKEMKHIAIAPDTIKCREVPEVPLNLL